MVRSYSKTRPRRGFSLIELVIVVVIIGIIAAIAIPRMSRGTAGAADSAVRGNLTILRNAIEMYASEHGGSFPSGTVAEIEGKLTKYTDINGGNAADARNTATGVIYGPYIRKIPPAEVGTLKGKAFNNKITAGTTAQAAASADGGWLYDADTGTVKINLVDGEVDSAGNSYFLKY